MTGLTLEQCEAQLAIWMDANTAVASNQSYSIDGRSLTRADAGAIRENIEYWDQMCQRKGRTGGGPRVRYAVPT